MSLSVPDFWKLVIESRLLTPEQCQLLGTDFGRVEGAAEADVKTLSQWLISRNALTAYQATILEAGRSGPFHYGEYKVYDRIEQGCRAGAFRAIHEPTSHAVLLQFVTGEASSDPQQWVWLVGQVQAHGSVVHPNLNRCFEAVDLSAFKFLVFDDTQGQTIDERVGGRKLNPADACRIVWQASLGLAALHQSGLVHGDVRPQNLWLDSNSNLQLLRDPARPPLPLHVAQQRDPDSLLVRADYLAPELAQPEWPPDALTDIYALGCTLYQLLTGHPPFEGGDATQKMNRHAGEPIVPLTNFGVPEQVGQVVAYMMAKNPQVRYQQAAIVCEQVAPFVKEKYLNREQPAPVATLAGFENWVAQRQAAAAAQAVAAAQAAAAAPQPIAAPQPVAAVQQIPAPAPAAPPPPAPEIAAPAPAISVGPAASIANVSGGSADEITQRYRKKRLRKKLIMLGTALVLLVAIAGGSYAAWPYISVVLGAEPKNKESNGTDPAPGTPEGSGQQGGDQANDGDVDSSGVKVVPDDGKLLWASPTTGPPINANYVPSGVRVLLAARPADIIASSQGEQIFAALGPDFQASRESWETAAGIKLGEVEQLLVGFHDNDTAGNMPLTSFVVRLIKPVAKDELVKMWGSPPVEAIADAESSIYSGSNGWSFFIPPEAGDAEVKLFVMGPKPVVSDSAKKGEAPPVLRRQIADLLNSSADGCHLTAVFAPNFFFNDEGQQLFAGPRSKVLKPLDWWLGDGLQAGMVCMHFDQQFYFEMRMRSQVGTTPIDLANQLRERLEQIPDRLESYIDTVKPPPYWTRLARRFPLQIGFLHRNTRVGVEGRQAVINSAMPAHAAPNLIASGELLMASGPGAATTVVTTKKPNPKTFEELLGRTYDFSIGSEDMINVAKLIQDEIRSEYQGLPFEFRIRLMGKDLEVGGITQNQRVSDFTMEGKSLSEVLTGIMIKANPIPNVPDPSELDQQLIWVLAMDPDDGKPSVLVTTRVAAEREKYALPKPFQPK